MIDRFKFRQNFLLMFVVLFGLILGNQIVYSQTDQGVKLADVKIIDDDTDSHAPVGFWQYPNRAVWIHITEDQRAFQCRISKDDTVYKSVGALENGQKIVWKELWGTDQVNLSDGRISLKGKSGKFSLVRVYQISDYRCRSPFQESGEGIGSGSGLGSGRGTGAGSGSGGGTGTGLDPNSRETTPPPGPTGPTRGLQIISKPRHKYTDLARQNGTQGTVELRITFLANGEIGTICIVKGLPDGLTEEAIAAVRQIRFQPAMRNGQAYSVTRTISFSFSIY